MSSIEIEIYNHLFSAIAEEMGASLMRAALSPNIKERRDFSCAIFDSSGEMLAQAAHIPVHLGSQPLSVEAVINSVELQPGQSALVNDPYAGGTHLPDLTLVTPVFSPGEDEIWFYVANRAHHADVGGITPGSMPLSEHIDDEGFRIPPSVVTDELIEDFLQSVRTPDERRGDLQAQIGANRRGAERLRELASRHGMETVRERSAELLAHSEKVMRATINQLPDGSWEFEDFLDDDGFGNEDIPIRARLTIEGDSADVDFSDSAPQTRGPVNAVYAITASATWYVFRCLAPADLPTNAGCMRPISVVAPEGTVVNATYPAPVAIGNVETSQRVVDVVFGALASAVPQRVPAASCGSMNNLLAGGNGPDGPFAYYETIGGGHGAGPGWNGASGLHTHMTNTLNTPVEALEHAYPFRVTRYGLRTHSGGAGQHRGGDGVVRSYHFLTPTTVTVQTERRVRGPWGLAGGEPGAVGINTVVCAGESQKLKPKETVSLDAGDSLTIETPGGGGHGSPEEQDDANADQ